MVESVCKCKFCGSEKPFREMKSWQYGKFSFRVVGICKSCYSRLKAR